MSDPAIIDAYAHVGLPRFHSVADYRKLMGPNSISRAVLSAFDAAPDLADIHGALEQFPNTFRALGVPLGVDDDEMRRGVAAQLAAGFSGLRLSDADVRERPWLLEQVAEAGRVPLPTGRASNPDTARTLLDVLNRYQDAVIVGCHFAGGGDPADLSGVVAELFSHPRFSVVFSSHGGFPAAQIERWAEAVLAVTGWERVLWGSEAPVLFWRSETIADAQSWVDRLGPTAEQKQAFFGGNAAKIYFAQPIELAPLQLPFDPWQRANEIPALLWRSGLKVDQRIAGSLVRAWADAGWPGTLGEFTEGILAQVSFQAAESNLADGR